MYCEGVKGECNPGQQEIAFRYDDAMVYDNHTIYKNGAKEIADQHGKSLTFMAKFDEREGNSCHIHISLRGMEWLGGVRRQPRDVTDVPQLHRRPAGDAARLHVVLRAEHQLLQAIRRRASRRRPSPGAWTTAPARCGSSATVIRCGWSAAHPAGRQPVPWRRRR